MSLNTKSSVNNTCILTLVMMFVLLNELSSYFIIYYCNKINHFLVFNGINAFDVIQVVGVHSKNDAHQSHSPQEYTKCLYGSSGNIFDYL